MPPDHPELAELASARRAISMYESGLWRLAEVTFTKIIEISYATQWDDMWWSLPKDMSADLMLEFRQSLDLSRFPLQKGSGKGNAAPITFEWEWQGKRGTKRGPDGEPTNISSYTLNFDRMEQKNNDTGDPQSKVAHFAKYRYTQVHKGDAYVS